MTERKMLEREPTIKMLRAAHDGPLMAGDYAMQQSTFEYLRDMFYAMFDAAPADRGADNYESAWLIEAVDARWGTGYFWRGLFQYEQWGTIDDAVRFARKMDAHRVINSLQRHEGRFGGTIGKYEACEHIWSDRPSVSQAGPLYGPPPGQPCCGFYYEHGVKCQGCPLLVAGAQAGPQQKVDEQAGDSPSVSPEVPSTPQPVSSAPPPQSRESETPETFEAWMDSQWSTWPLWSEDERETVNLAGQREAFAAGQASAERRLAALTQENLEHARVQVVRNRMIEELDGKIVALARERDALREALRAVNDAMPGAFQCVTDSLSSPGGGA